LRWPLQTFFQLIKEFLFNQEQVVNYFADTPFIRGRAFRQKFWLDIRNFMGKPRMNGIKVSDFTFHWSGQVSV
jgi:hypothetical protein